MVARDFKDKGGRDEDDLYAAIDLATKKIQAQIRKRHSKFKAKNTRVAASAKRSLLSMAA